MNSTEPIRLRPMSQAEREAVDMADDGKSWDEITAQTRLERAQIAAAIELRDRFATGLNFPATTVRDAPPAGLGPDTITDVGPPSDADPDEEAELDGDEPELLEEPEGGRTETAAEPEPADIATALAPDDLAALLDAANSSPQPRAQELAAQISAGVDELRTILTNDDKARVLIAARDVLARQLAQAEVELAELLGTVPADATATPAKPASTPGRPRTASVPKATATDPPKAALDRLSYDPGVRAWAKTQGWEVGVKGRIAGAAVKAYIAAH